MQVPLPSDNTPAVEASFLLGLHSHSGATEQLGGETVQAVVLSRQTPSDAPSAVERVHLQSQTGQPPPGTVQAAPPLLQVPAVAPSKTEGVQLQVPQGGGTTGQLFAATVQGWDGKPVQEAPPHPGATAWLLDCVPALDASVVDGVQLQLPQDPH